MKMRVLLPWRWHTFPEIAQHTEYPSPWWGMVHQCPYSDRRLFMPIPLNLVARGVMRVWKWMRWSVTKQEREVYASYNRGYHEGRAAEYRRQEARREEAEERYQLLMMKGRAV